MAGKGMEFTFIATASGESNFEVNWTDENHARFIFYYGVHTGTEDVDEYLSACFPLIHPLFISCIRKMHEMSLNKVESTPVFQPRRLTSDENWSKEEEIELKYAVEEAYDDHLVPEGMRNIRWEIIANVLGGGRSSADCEEHYGKMDKDKVDNDLSIKLQAFYREVAWERIKCALAEAEEKAALARLELAKADVSKKVWARAAAEERFYAGLNQEVLKAQDEAKTSKAYFEAKKIKLKEAQKKAEWCKAKANLFVAQANAIAGAKMKAEAENETEAEKETKAENVPMETGTLTENVPTETETVAEKVPTETDGE